MKETDTKKSKKDSRKKVDVKWVGTIFGATILISAFFSFLSDALLERVQTWAAFVVLLVIVLVGIVFDIIGVAVTTADERPFHSMAARNLPEAKEAIRLIRHASRVSSFCNDVVGDICGVISGSASAVIAAGVIRNFEPVAGSFFKLFLSALVAALTVGGKAVGKTFAINAGTPVVHLAAKLIYRVKAFFRPLRGLLRKGK